MWMKTEKHVFTNVSVMCADKVVRNSSYIYIYYINSLTALLFYELENLIPIKKHRCTRPLCTNLCVCLSCIIRIHYVLIVYLEIIDDDEHRAQ